jgi:1-acyl-sn-glycerol-3-phosphate acyltransferase
MATGMGEAGAHRYTVVFTLTTPTDMDLAATFSADTAPLEDRTVLEQHIEQALAAKPMTGWELDALHALVQRWFRPTVYGAHRIPERPCLFIGNHALFAVDGLVILPLMLKQYTRFLRPMGDKFLFSQPAIARFMLRRGATMGHPEVCRALMMNGQDILIFPGGAHEAVKPAEQSYHLLWKERFGFVRLAAEQGYTIVPFGLVGPEEFYEHIIEGRDLPESPLGHFLQGLGVLNENTRRDLIPPLARGALGTAVPRPIPCHLGFGEPIDLSRYRGEELSRTQLRRIRNRVAKAVEGQLEALMPLARQPDEEANLLMKLLRI